MKKLLALFGSTTIVIAPMATLVSCGSKDHLDNGSSILFEFNREIDGSTKVSINEKLLNDLLSSATLQTRLTNDVIKLIKFSFLKKISLEDKDIISALEKNKTFLNDYSIEYAKKYFKILEEDVVKNMEKKRKNEGKNWNKYLMNKYPSYVKNEKKPSRSEISFLEEKYKFDQYFENSQTNNVDDIFSNIILKKQATTRYIKIEDVQENIDSFKKLLKNNELIQQLNSNNATRNNFINAFNASQKDINNWVTPKKNDFFTESGSVKDEAKIKQITEELKVNIEYKFIPENISEINQNNTSNLLFLSNSQRYLFNRYYEVQAPVSISEVVYSFSKDKEFANGIKLNLFEDGTDNNHINEINEFFKKYLGGAGTIDQDNNYSNEKWIKMIASGSVDTNCGTPSIKKSDKLLTLSSDHSQELKNIVYDYLTAKKEYGTELASLDLKSIVEQINRKKDKKNSFYGYLKSDPSKIFYIGTDGLHIVNIDGYQLLQNDKLFNKDATPIDNKIGESGKINSKTIERFLNFKTFEDNFTTNENQKVNSIQHLNLDKLDDDKNKTYNSLNDSVESNYLRFLINNSLVKGLKGVYTNFDLKSDVDAWLATEIKQEENDSMKWSIYQIEYMKEILGIKNTDEFIKMFVKFKQGTEILQTKVRQKIENSIMSSNNSLTTKYIKSNEDWKENIEKELKSTYPKLTFDLTQPKLQEQLKTIFQATQQQKKINDLKYKYFKNGGNQ